jgi:hypothetical protein
MPHISYEDKMQYEKLINEIRITPIITKGDLEFLVYQLLKRYMMDREIRYSTLHEAVYGGLHACEEYKRLHLDKREDEAIKNNGEA